MISRLKVKGARLMIAAFTLIELLAVITIISLLNGQDADRLQIFSISFYPHHIPVIFDKKPLHKARGETKGINYLYANGHIKNLLTLEGTK